MVIEDISTGKSSDLRWNPADPIERFFSFCLDVTLLTPLVAFVCSIHMREFELDISQGFQSGLGVSMAVTGLFTSISIQTILVYFFSATPGQSMLNLRVQSLESDKMSWGASFLRSISFHFSVLLFFVPFVEVYTHRLGRCLHDRVSDSIVLQPYPKSQQKLTESQIHQLKLITLVGCFFVSLFLAYQIGEKAAHPDQLTLNPSTGGRLDSFVAQAVLLKKFDSETKKKVDELLWKSRAHYDRELAYFYRWRSNEEEENKALIKAKICQDENSKLCRIIEGKFKTHEITKIRNQTELVALMIERAEKSDFNQSLAAYDALKKFRSLDTALKVWDVGLFKRAEKFLQSERAPASEDLKDRVESYWTEREGL